MVKSIAITTAVVLFSSLLQVGCSAWGSGDPPPGPTTQTCDNREPDANAQRFHFVAQDKRTYCIVDVGAEFANSAGDARSCLERQYPGLNFLSDPLRTVVLAVYSPAMTGYYCQTRQAPDISAANAEQCARRTYCSNCVYRDITTKVSSQADINNWCSLNPTPPPL